MIAPMPPVSEAVHAALLPTLGLSSNVPLFPHQASGYAFAVDLLYFALLGFSGLVMLGVLALVGYFVIKYRAGSGVDRSGRIANTMPYELSLIVAFAIIGLGIFGWAATVYFDIERPPAEATTYYVVGKQWMWKIRHPGGQEELNALHVPTGKNVKLVMTSQDVIHSFYVPAFRAKQDVLPDQYTTLWFKPTRPGVYHLYCAEYCGTEHSAMTGKVVVMKPAAYEHWLSAQGGEAIPGMPGGPGGTMFVQNESVFTQLGCNACHLRDSDNRAPRLDGIFGRPVRLQNGQTIIADEQYIRESILRPNAKISAGYREPSLMPTYEGQVSERQVQELVQFIKSIRNGWPPPPEAAPPEATPEASPPEASSPQSEPAADPARDTTSNPETSP